MDEKLNQIIELLQAQLEATRELAETNRMLIAALAEDGSEADTPALYLDGSRV